MPKHHTSSLPALSPLALVFPLMFGSAALAAGDHAAAAKPAATQVATAHPSATPHGPAAAPTTAAAPVPAAAPAAAKPAGDNLEALRQRLVEKLGGVKPPEAPGGNVVRVASRSGVAEHAAPARKPSAAVVAAVAAHRAEKSGHEPQAAAHRPHWGYYGEAGPQTWGGLQPEFAKCGNGTRQSPIDIRDGIRVDLDPVQFDYRASGMRVVDNGHTVQVNVGAGNTIQVMGRRYELVQFHFHRPSEERIDGRQFEMDVHLVHKDLEGRLAVIAVLLERGPTQPVVQTVWNNLPLEKGEETQPRAVIDLNHLLPPDRGYYTYMGSLTTPPCTEGVLWMVMRQPVSVSAEQIDIFARLYPMNARPVQSAAGRLIKQSQ